MCTKPTDRLTEKSRQNCLGGEEEEENFQGLFFQFQSKKNKSAFVSFSFRNVRWRLNIDIAMVDGQVKRKFDGRW